MIGTLGLYPSPAWQDYEDKGRLGVVRQRRGLSSYSGGRDVLPRAKWRKVDLLRQLQFLSLLDGVSGFDKRKAFELRWDKLWDLRC